MPTFRITHKDKHSNARTGIIKTAHGTIHNVTFMQNLMNDIRVAA